MFAGPALSVFVRRRLSGAARCALALLLLFAWLPQVSAQTCNTPNLARSAVAFGHTTYPGYSAQRVNDGDRSTALGGDASWVNDYGTWPATLDLTLASPARIDRVQLFTTRGYEATAYDIQLRVDGAWRTVSSVRGNSAVSRDDRFAPQLTDAVRIVAVNGSVLQPYYFRVNELEVYACGGAAASTRLAGRVVAFDTGQGLGNVVVDLGGGITAITDAGGNYVFPAVPPGTYTLRPRLAGWTFGSDAFLIDQFTVVLGGGSRFVQNLIGYNRHPIVYVTGWTDNFNRFNPVVAQLQSNGYRAFDANIQTSLGYTPPLHVNALRVRSAIDTARYQTGQPRVILFGHSMGGLVARAYMESVLYRNDVSQIFTFGTPHRGAPAITGLACLPNQPAVCEMSKPAMQLFNVTHGQRPGTVYHAIGGDAPMWRRHEICFRIFGRRICIRSIPVPSFEFRNGWGWTSGVLIPGEDDGLIQTYSSTGMPGFLDRMVTQEIHIRPGLGHRDYYSWGDNVLSQQTYWNCLHPVLVARSRSHCGGPSFQFPFRVLTPQAPALAGSMPPYRLAGAGNATADGADEFNQRSLNVRKTLLANGRIEREFLVDGSPTLFAARWLAGSARITLIDPSGQVFDPEFAASIYEGEPQPGEPVGDELDPSMVLYQAGETTASYQFPAPRPGRWRMIVDGGADIEAGGTDLATFASFASPLGIEFDALFPFLISGTPAELTLTPSAGLLSAAAEIRIRRIDGGIDVVPMLRQADGRFTGSYDVPDAVGIAEATWFVSGLTASGHDFERGGSESLQIGRRSLKIASVGVETAIGSRKRYQALEVPVEVSADYSGPAMVSADLVAADGQVVANAAQLQDVVAGANTIRLRFNGEDIYAGRRDGPYRLTNLITTDQREAANLSDWLQDEQLTTAAYDYRLFGPLTPFACDGHNLMLGGTAVATGTAPGYSPARAIDGDFSTALGGEYSWSNGGDARFAAFAAAPAGGSDRLEIALPAAGLAEQVLVYSTLGYEARDYDLEYFDGTAWTLIESVRGNVQTVREHRMPPTRVERLRIVAHSGPDHDTAYVRINEVAAYRCSATAGFGAR